MLHVVRFVDRADRLRTREEFLAAHLAWLEEHRDRVLVAGSLRRQAEASPVGGLWIVEAACTADVEALIHSDPFWTQGLRESFEILLWSKAFPGRLVPI